MKFSRLYLKNFGCFADHIVDLPVDAGTDLHLIIGANEAGKSTILRAVTGLLFGIPERSTDAFRHGDNKLLRVGAQWVMPNHSVHAAMRRKARGPSLFPIDAATGEEVTGTALPDGFMAQLLGGLDESLYDQLFGLDLAQLEKASSELLEGDSDLGRMLFQAATGLQGLRGVLRSLSKRAGAIFVPRGSSGTLNKRLADYGRLRTTVKDETVRTSAWEERDRTYRKAAERREQIRSELNALRTQCERLERLAKTFGPLTELRRLQAGLPALEPIPLLAEGAKSRREAAQDELGRANLDVEKARGEHRKAEQALEHIRVNQALLAEETLITTLGGQVDGYRNAVATSAARAAAVADERGHAVSLLAQIDPAVGLDQARSILPSATTRARVDELLAQHAGLSTQIEKLEGLREQAQLALAGLNTQLAALPASIVIGDLEAALETAKEHAIHSKERASLQPKIMKEEMQLSAAVAALWDGSLEDLLTLTVPLESVATSFEHEFGLLDREASGDADNAPRMEADLEKRTAELAPLTAVGDVVTHDDVLRARGERDARWEGIQRALTGEPPPGFDGPVAVGGFDAALQDADRKVDQLLANTERMTKAAALRKEIVALEGRIANLDQRRIAREGRRADLQRRWEEHVAVLRRRDLPPTGLREWLASRQALIARHGDLEEMRGRVLHADSELERLRTVLANALSSVDAAVDDADSVAALYSRAQKLVSDAREASGARAAHASSVTRETNNLNAAASTLERLSGQMQAWADEWKVAVGDLRLSADATPAVAAARLEQFVRLAAHLDGLEKAELAREKNDQLISRFERDVVDLSQRVAEADEALRADTLLEHLIAALGHARDARTEHSRLTTQIAGYAESVRAGEARASAAQKVLDGLVLQAGCARVDELEQIEMLSDEKRMLLGKIEGLTEQIVLLNSRSLAEVLEDIGSLGPDDVGRELVAVKARISASEADLLLAQDAFGDARRELDAVDGRGAAAQAQQDLELVDAEIEEHARDYAQVRLAEAILGNVIKAYQDRHQGPLLLRAQAMFVQMTGGAYERLIVDYDDDRQVLVCERPSGAMVKVSGLSKGTRDQLYLALRLAAIELHVASRGPFPVIVDDLLVQFDDTRAEAALEVLAELSTKTQVLCFSHHAHLIDIATRCAGAARIHVHRLPAPAPG